MPIDLRLPFDDEPQPADRVLARDETARAVAVDPSRNVVLEASAGTGKTRVLVTRYINLLRAGVDPANILAITFTRKAAAEMRERIVRELRSMAGQSPADAARWRELRDRLGDIAISTIDAFCLSLLREFPLEADLDPAFQVADETEVPRLADEALDAALRAGRRLAARDEDVALLLAGLGERRLRAGLAGLLDRRRVAGRIIRGYLAGGPSQAPSAVFAQALSRLEGLLSAGDAGSFGCDGPILHPAFPLLEADLRALTGGAADAASCRAAVDRLAPYFLTAEGQPRKRPAPSFRKEHCASPEAWKRHSQAVARLSPYVADVMHSLERDLNRAMARGAERLFRIAVSRYRRALDGQAVVDFGEGLARTLSLLRQMDEFAQSRYRLEARYHHVLVDEFQDTSAAQWQLVASLIESWGEGVGLAHEGPLRPSIFVVGDRKQSIYAFRDADVRLLRRARRHIQALRSGGSVRRSIARSFRSSAPLLAFSNDLFAALEKIDARTDAFRYRTSDAFPVHLAPPAPAAHALGLAVGGSGAEVSAAVAAEIDRILREGTVRDRQTGLARRALPGDIAILFRSRESHREFELALEALRIPTYVYKGLGFFDADEVKDLVALLRFLAAPSSDLRAAGFLRSRFVRLSDRALRALAPRIAQCLVGDGGDREALLDAEDRTLLRRLREVLPRWQGLVDRIPPAELLDLVLNESAYAFELRGGREAQARENLKKVRGLMRRIQNRGYATLGRIAEQLERLSAGDESNAVIDAVDAVNLMTVHAAKGLEFPIVFLVNLGRGTGTHGDPIVALVDATKREPLVSIGGALAEADEAVRSRDVEETKRLLYVAVTRARERLYLSAVLRDGRFKPGRGSLGEVLPASVREVMSQASGAKTGAVVDWRTPEGGVHRFTVCSTPDAAQALVGTTVPGADEQASRPADFGAWQDAGCIRRLRVTAASSLASAGDAPPRPQSPPALAPPESRLVGTLVHRLFQSEPSSSGAGNAVALAVRARALLAPDELDDLASTDELVTEAVAAFTSLRNRADVRSLLDSASCLYEVPFSLKVDDWRGDEGGTVVLRGAIDCLARLPDGRLRVVEIKTGRPHDWHAEQLEWYVRAARALFPGVGVDGTILYVMQPAGASERLTW